MVSWKNVYNEYLFISRRVTYEDINELSPMEGRETPFSLQMQIAEVCREYKRRNNNMAKI